jgi:hypothetical protein
VLPGSRSPWDFIRTIGRYAQRRRVPAHRSARLCSKYAYSIDPTRPGLAALRFLFSSLFGDRIFLWHSGLVFVNFLVALILIYLIGLMSGQDARPNAPAIWIGLGWCCFPGMPPLCFGRPSCRPFSLLPPSDCLQRC